MSQTPVECRSGGATETKVSVTVMKRGLLVVIIYKFESILMAGGKIYAFLLLLLYSNINEVVLVF